MFASVPESTIDYEHVGAVIAPNSTLKVLNWNVAKTNNDKTWQRDYQQIIDEFEPDIICLQEVRLDAENQRLASFTHMNWQFAPNFKNAFDNSYCGVLIGAKAGCVKHRALHTKHSEPIANTPKVAIFSEFEIADRADRPMVVSVHAINFVPLGQFEAQLRAIAKTLSQYQGSIVLAGDFNTWSKRRLRSLLHITEGLDLRPVTFPTEDQQYLKRFLLSPPLDHLFYRGLGQIPGSTRVLNTPSSSDHNPLFAAFKL